MNHKTRESFEKELEQARKSLKKLGRDIRNLDASRDHQNKSHDFELPYSSLPKIHGKKWNKSKLFTC